MELFLSASLFVGWPSHLFHSHICDLLGSDWYGNIIIPSWILSPFSLTLALPLLSISYITFATSTFLCRSCLSPSLSSNGSFSHRQPDPFLPYFNTPLITWLMTLLFFLHWLMRLEVQSSAEQQSDLLRERWRASHTQSSLARYTVSCVRFVVQMSDVVCCIFS